jgi:hypothetical protein
MKRWITLLAVVVMLGAVAPASATVVSYANRATFDAAFPAPTIFEGWDSFASGTQILDGATVNGILYNSNAGGAEVLGGGYYNTTPPNSLTRINNGSGFEFAQTITFTFGGSMQAFGIDFNTFATGAGAFKATTDQGEIALSNFDPFPSISTGQFLGFSTDVAFSSVTIEHNINTNPFALDSLRAEAVPEPCTIVIWSLLGALGITFGWWRRRKA